MRVGLLLVLGFLVLAMTGCGVQSDVGQNEINKAYPNQSQADVEEAMKKAGKYDEYKAAQERDAAVAQSYR